MGDVYSGLDRETSRNQATRREAGVPFAVNAESTVVLTPAGRPPRPDDPGGEGLGSGARRNEL